MTKDEAQKAIEDAKLIFEVEKEEYSKDVEEGKVISQDPTYMERFNKVKQGSTVKVVISKGQEKTKVPKVIGMKQDEAVKALEDAKLKVEVIEEPSKKVQEGYVISQETDAETETFAGETVKIHVSTGVEKASVPNVIGNSEADAKKSLEALGFVVATTTAEDSSKATGVVLKQSIDSGKSVEKGTSITITVNSYRQSRTVNLVINVKSLTGGYTETSSATNTETNTESSSTNNTANKNVDVSISIDGNVVETRQNIDKNNTNLSINVTGNGTKTVTVNAGGSKTTKTIDFDTANSVNIS